MSTINDAAIAFCKERLVERVITLNSLLACKGEVLHIGAGALLVQDASFDALMLSWDDEATALGLLRDMQAPEWLVMESTALDEEADKLHGFSGSMVCVTCLYPLKTPLPIALPMVLQPLSRAHVPLVARHYDKLPLEALELACREGRLFGGFLGDEMAGFIGIHEEGAMGMLHVFEKNRGRGYATAIESLLVNRLLAQGRLPFGQVVVGNEPSMALHRKLGFVFSRYPGSWRWLHAD